MARRQEVSSWARVDDAIFEIIVLKTLEVARTSTDDPLGQSLEPCSNSIDR